MPGEDQHPVLRRVALNTPSHERGEHIGVGSVILLQLARERIRERNRPGARAESKFRLFIDLVSNGGGTWCERVVLDCDREVVGYA